MKALEEGDIDSETGKIMQRTWAYRHKDGGIEARIFLTPGAETPEGWEDTPAKCQGPPIEKAPEKVDGRTKEGRRLRAAQASAFGAAETGMPPEEPESADNDHDADDS